MLKHMRDRRFDLRSAGPWNGVIHWRSDAGEDLQTAGLMEDLSFSGARIRVNRPIPVKAQLAIVVRDKQLPAKVRYCTRTKVEYIIGVEFQPASQETLRSLCQIGETVGS